MDHPGILGGIVEQSLGVFWKRLQAVLGVEMPPAAAGASSDRLEAEPSGPDEPPRGEPAAEAAGERALGERSISFRTDAEAGVCRPDETEWDWDDVSQRLLAALPQVEPRAAEGAPVSLTRLREWPGLKDLPKAVFDRAALELAVRGVVVLNRHDYPASLSDEERQKLVQDDRGCCYIGIALRR